MAIYYFSLLSDGDSFAFDPFNDELIFNVTAADVSFEDVAGDTSFTADARTVTLVGLAREEISTSNVSFLDGSLLLVGDNSPNTVDDNAANELIGSSGADKLSGLGGDDSLFGGAGNDVLIGGAGNDLLNGGLGVDTASYTGASVGVTVNLALTAPQATGQGLDTLQFVENLWGSDFGDDLIGSDGNNVLRGREGSDIMSGGIGNDILVGGAGVDALTGGDGADTFRDSPSGLNGDSITDFSSVDSIVLTGATFGSPQVRYNVDSGALSFDTDISGSFETATYLPAHLVGGFAATIVGSDTHVAFDPWNHKIWGGAPSDKPIVGNFDGVGGDEYGVYRVATAEWFLYGQPPYVWGGGPYDVPVVGDYNGDGRDDFGVYRVNTAEWWIVGQPLYVWGGGPYDKPVVGDFNGDGVDDFGVYRVNTAEWWIVGQPKYVWGGGPNDVPVVGDYNGDGIDDFGVYRKDTAEWWIVGQPLFVWGGGPNDTPVVGDFNGDGRDDFGVYRSDTGEWLIAGQPTEMLGGTGYAAVPADYDGNGTTDPAVYFEGIWASDVLI